MKDQQSKSTTQQILNVINRLLGLFFLLVGVVGMSSLSPISSIMMIIIAIAFLPITNQILLKKFNFQLHWIVRLFIILISVIIVGSLADVDETYNDNTSKNNIKIEENINRTTTSDRLSLESSYNKHKNFIWNVCKEGVKILNSSAGDFQGPSYAGKYGDEFIVKGSSDAGDFRCVFVPDDNQWGMNLSNVTREY